MPYLGNDGTALPIKKFAEGNYQKAKKSLDGTRAANTTR